MFRLRRIKIKKQNNMDLVRRMENVSVLGAAGKMGSGILVLLSFEMAKLKLGKKEDKEFVLNAIDVSQPALIDLLGYVRSQLVKHAEKNIVELREWYKERADLVDNEEVINQFVEDVMAMIQTSTRIETTYSSDLIFEAIKEDHLEREEGINAFLEKRHPNWE